MPNITITLEPLTSFWAPLICLGSPLIYLIFTWFAWFSAGQFANMYGTFLETTENQANQVKIRWIKGLPKEIKGAQMEVRGSKVIVKFGIELLWPKGFKKCNIYDSKLTFCISGDLKGHLYEFSGGP